MKQHLRLKAFYGTRNNDMRRDLEAIAVDVLAAIVQRRLGLEEPLPEFNRFSACDAREVAIFKRLENASDLLGNSNQSILFNFYSRHLECLFVLV
jgi:hypothetical protein